MPEGNQGVGPALRDEQAAACAAGALIVSALAATLSLFLPQIATVLLVLVGVGWVASVNLLVRFEVGVGPVAAAVDRLGPPLATAILAALAPWVESAAHSGGILDLSLRLGVWAAAGSGLLWLAFRRADLGR